MKRASTIVVTSSVLLVCAGVAHAQVAQKNEPAAQATPVPDPVPAPSGQAPPGAPSPADAASSSALPVLPPESSAAASAPPPVAPARSAEPASAAYVPATSEPEPERESEAKNAFHRGFAFAASFGFSAPAGSATGASGDDLSRTFSGQFPFALEVGGDVTPSLFVGLYGSYAAGGVAGEADQTCNRYQLSCSSHSLRGGLAVRYRFSPGETLRPWIGYAIGYEQSSVSLATTLGDRSETFDITGWELGHFTAGLDLMTGENHVGIGPFVDLGLGQYSHIHGEATGQAPKDADITNKALHEWITFGLRATFMP